MPADPGEDGPLLARLQAGDLQALGALYDKYRLPMFHSALAITHDKAAAEDILQECFLRLNAYAHRLDGSPPLKPWLYRVTVNLSYTWVTRRARRQVSLEEMLERVDRWVTQGRATPEHYAEARDMRESVRSAVAGLPFNQRVAIVLYYVGGLDLHEIAYIVDCPIGTVKSRLHHGREALRAMLAGRVDPEATWGYGVAYDFT
jgi:RNA polymerase sigma-70 factor (ECF subfamily)